MVYYETMGKGISYSAEQTLVGGNKSPQDVCEGGLATMLLTHYNNVVQVIYKEWESVLYHGIKTPRSALKNEAITEDF